MKKSEGEMGQACGMQGGEEKQTRLWVKNFNKSDHMEDPSIDGIIILK
jgi:hypothetical protein